MAITEDLPASLDGTHSALAEPFEYSQEAFEEPPPSLGDEFLLHLERSKFDTKQEFLPEGYLDKLITRNALRDDLFVDKADLDAKDENLIDFIITSAKKAFATAYCAVGSGGSALLPTMMYFQSIGFSDKALPIEDLRTVEPTRNAQTEIPFPFSHINRNMALRRTWAPMRIRNFYRTQWMFLAPVFSRDHFHHVLSPNVVLPFVWVGNVTKDGRFSKVYEVEIHENHQKLLDLKGDGTPPHVAIKEILTTENDEELRQEMESNFMLEANALSDIASLEHTHIIERIAAITIGARHYFMFQWADGGNLREFWRDNPRPKLTPDLVRQSVRQLTGLADALMALHHYKDDANYRHGGVAASPTSLQIGYPELSPTRNEVHFEIIRQWIKDCDNNPAHAKCRLVETPTLPDRLLDVQGLKIRLVETKDLRDQYLALSHPWGKSKEHIHFCTYTRNIEDRKKGIDWEELPRTFKDAITITRKLGFRYLWIDSLCIVQGPDGDFDQQSKHMPKIFNFAYCVLAASRATGQHDGFLGERLGRDYITFKRGEEDMYHICEEIDDFQADVIDGSLNQRGWVLQERALARRTVYFTEKQTYWECGAGIRCETFTKLKR
ncbi:hypothetical protein CGCSCA4_v000201 [Colletotrichum siamense]|uniref:Protein kinase domain-containing protein n=1 Tax=Colletotrichum siamense TaxID=690259 RepID=A0A9P5EY84_COLSI|nr:hypothetical protein CGCSCA4_v000201 [Colletotrichum siamense]KAF4861893.1 hypothetical protein CGCSCA2_v004019 [Colletotrichum siamense]